MKTYDHKAIEKKWQDIWEESGAFHASESTDKPKFYALIEFPYPSGQGLHVGHPRPYTAMDIVARKRRMQVSTLERLIKVSFTSLFIIRST